jgi:hypothetical protein
MGVPVSRITLYSRAAVITRPLDGEQRIDFRQGQVFSILRNLQNGTGTPQPPIKLVPGALSSGLKRPGTEADHHSPAS